jgi:hypothetical protein
MTLAGTLLLVGTDFRFLTLNSFEVAIADMLAQYSTVRWPARLRQLLGEVSWPGG